MTGNKLLLFGALSLTQKPLTSINADLVKLILLAKLIGARLTVPEGTLISPSTSKFSAVTLKLP